MCGIIGFVDKKGALSDSEKTTLLKKMLERIAHRGRDSHGVFVEGNVAIAHARLSILDLSLLGHQPMKSTSSDIYLSYNGEIYNHVLVRRELSRKYSFRSSSDTETLLYGYEEWGTRILPRIKGMFAFSIYDRANQLLFLAGDRFAIKPLYYLETEDWFAWSSEIKSLFALPNVSPLLNKEALPEYLLFRSIAGKETLLHGISKLLPGESLNYRLDKQELGIFRYWDLTKEKLVRESGDPVSIIEPLLKESVRDHLLADVPVGIQLSGGVDSSLVGALVRKNIPEGQELHSFSIGLQDGEWNEFPHSRKVASLLGTIHHELVFNEEEYCRMLPTATYHYDEPINHSHSVPMLMLAEEASKHVKVLLSGEGSDEIFGGYLRYLRSITDASFSPESVLWSNAFSSEQDVSILLGDFPLDLNFRRGLIDIVRARSPLFQLGWYDLNTYLPPLLLRQDKMGMRSTLENRVPFLDHDLVKAAFSLNDDEKIHEGQTKMTLKAVARNYLPEDIVFRKKVGFSQPIARWLRNDKLFGRYLEMILRSNKERGLFDQSTLERFVNEHRTGIIDHSAILWTLINLELWMRIFIDHEDPSEIWASVRF